MSKRISAYFYDKKSMNFRQPVLVLISYLVILPMILTACVSAPPKHIQRIDLTEARNFRDLGGYPTKDGKHIKKGLLYRSDNLSELNDDDLKLISHLKLKRIYDLRNEDERMAEPDILPAENSIRLIGLPFDYAPLDTATMQKRILSGDLEDGEAKQMMLDSYRTYIIDYRKQFAVMLHGLSEADALPTLIHCVHGKDRTGLAAALVLQALGVPRRIILEDYLLSNTFWESETDRLSLLATIASLFRTPREEVRSLMEARPEYLNAAFKAADEKYGSLDNYLREGLGLDDASITMLRNALLE